VNANHEKSAGIEIIFGAVLLAAGASVRMGRAKLLLPWGETTVIGHLLGTWTELGALQIGVLLAAGENAINAELDRLGVSRARRIVNLKPERGMFSSIQCAAHWDQWDSRIAHWAIVLGDQPHLQHATLRSLLRFVARHPEKICQPARRFGVGRGALRPRHPVILPRRFFELLAGSAHKTLRDFLSSLSADVALMEIDDPGLDLDLDTPADYLNAEPSKRGTRNAE
jgi:molybdenum cofactor cytidylyltransferase